MLWIVSGPSSVGKSMFLESERCREITGLPPDAPVLFAFQDNVATADLENALFHYNLLRPASFYRRRQLAVAATWRSRICRIFKRGTSPEAEIGRLRRAATGFRHDQVWNDVANQPVKKKVIVLVADQNRIRERVQQRRKIEQIMPSGRSNSYQTEQWLWLYERLDLLELYAAWYAELDAAGIEYLIVDSNNPQFRLCPAP
jgi:hypothetical protein